MKNKNLIFKNKLDTLKTNHKETKIFSKKFEKIYLEIKSEIKNDNKTLHVLSNKFKNNFTTKNLNKFKKFKSIAIIGMGGSILGSEAIYNSLKTKIKKKIYFFNNLEEEKIKNFRKKEKNLSKTLFIIISKSGKTIETIFNFLSLKILKKNQKNVIIISEKKNNTLFNLSKKFNLFYVEHKSFIGGRYSVLSEVGLIPTYLMGLNIMKIRSNILDFLRKKNKNFLKQTTIKLAQFIKSKKFNNLIFLNYEPKFEKFLYWCQQLIAESLGKSNKGFLPVISNVPKDHHSLLQLYLDGPKDKIFHIFSSKQKSNLKIKTKNSLIDVNFIKNKDLSTIKASQKNALISSLVRKKIPFRETLILQNNEVTLGKLFSQFMLETIIVGKMLGINPFDQPAVEQVKIDTKKNLIKNPKNNL